MYLRVIAAPGARKEKVEEKGTGMFTIWVREPAEGNRANTRIREILAERYRVPLAKVRVLTGHRSRSKLMSISS